MNKNYYITHPIQSIKSNSAINVSIDSLNSIFDCSADSVYCGCLEYVDSQILDSIISKLLNKIKPLGVITFSIKNIKHICSLLINGSIPTNDLLKHIQNFQNILSSENIYTKIDSDKYKVIQLSKDNETIAISIERQKI